MEQDEQQNMTPAAPSEGLAPQDEPPPKKRRRFGRHRLALIIIAAVIVVVAGAAIATAEYTSRSAFCDTCHEMDAYYHSWQASVHAETECRACHIPPGAMPYIKTKLFASREIWVHITGNPKPPLAVTREIPNANCLACHPNPGDVTLTNSVYSHDIHESQNCMACHVRLVHRDVNPPYYASPAAMSSCLKCHDGKTAPSQCSNCHTPGHEPRGECNTCHNQDSWTTAGTEHPFPRVGAHASLACADCHVAKPGTETIPGTSLAKANPACVSCHGDKHGGLTDCAGCHTPEGWRTTTFVHPQEGKHIPAGEKPLDCASCHPSGFGSHSCTPCHDGTPQGD